MDSLNFDAPNVIPKSKRKSKEESSKEREEAEREENLTDDWPYYALFNVEKDCSLAEIRDRYRHLSLQFHPDKSPIELRDAAQNKFRQIQEAYCVLSDPRQRKLYDSLGKDSFEIPTSVIRSNNLAEDAKKYKLDLSKEEIENQIGIENEITLSFLKTSVSASALKSTWSIPDSPFYVACSLGVRAMGARTQTGNVVSLGSHAITAGYKASPLPGLDLNVEVTPIPYPSALIKSTYSIDNDTFCSVSTQFTQLHIPPLHLTAGRRLWENTTGYMTLLTPSTVSYSSFTLGLSNPKWNSSLNVGKTDMSIAMSRQFYPHLEGVGGRNTIKLGTQMALSSGLVAYVSLKSRLTEKTSLISSLNLALNGGMTIKFKVTRLRQKVVIPIFLGRLDGLSIVAVCCAATTASVLTDYYFLAPRQGHTELERLKDLRYENAEELKTSELAAKEAIKIIQRNLPSQLAAEEKKEGLIIVSASYCSLSDQTLCQDVRIPLQALVINSQLRIPSGSSKSHLVGFYDPAYGEKKHLKIVYTFAGRLHETTVRDRESLSIPKRKDQIENSKAHTAKTMA